MCVCDFVTGVALCWWLSGKDSACHCRRRKRHGFNPGSRRSPGAGNGNPFQCPCLRNPMDVGIWQATVQESQRVRHDWVCTHTYTELCVTTTTVEMQSRSISTGPLCCNFIATSIPTVHANPWQSLFPPPSLSFRYFKNVTYMESQSI